MNKEHIIQMALESSSMEKLPWNGQYIFKTQKELVDFAAAIRAATKEEDARICEQSDENDDNPDTWGWHSKDYARAIRASK